MKNQGNRKCKILINSALLPNLFQNPSKPAFLICSSKWSAASWIPRTTTFISGSCSLRSFRSLNLFELLLDRCKSKISKSGFVFRANASMWDLFDVIPTTSNPKRVKVSDKTSEKNLLDSAIRTLLDIYSEPLYQDFPNTWSNYTG